MKKSLSSSLFGILLLVACSKNDSPPESNSSLFSRGPAPVYESPIGLAADPSVLMSNDTLFMYYSAEEGLAVVYSLDNGNSWLRPNQSSTDYVALGRRPNEWDNTLETVEVLKVNGQYQMYFAGYREGESDNSYVENYEIGLAESTNGFDFTRVTASQEQPILSRDISNENTNDRHAMTSPGIVYNNGMYYMIYAGWNVTNDWTGPNAGIRILGATSADGIQWNKLTEPLLNPAEVTYSPDVNEASLMITEDGMWYLPFSTDKSIGLARSSNFEGPYEVYPEAIVNPEFDWDSEVTAPDGFVQDGKIRLWFHGVKEPLYWPWVIGYVEADYPLEW